jgi:transposase
MRTAYKCRAYPDPEQMSVLNRTFGCVRVVWNRTLAWRHARYHGEQATTNFTQANAYLVTIVGHGGQRGSPGHRLAGSPGHRLAERKART